MIPRLVPEISPCDAFCDEQQEEQEQQELGILGSRCWSVASNKDRVKLWLLQGVSEVRLPASALCPTTVTTTSFKLDDDKDDDENDDDDEEKYDLEGAKNGSLF